MATKKGSKAAKKPAAEVKVAVPSPAPTPIDVIEIGERASELVSDFGGHATYELEEKVKQLRRELANAETELELHLLPLRQVEVLLRQPRSLEPLDMELAKAIAILQLMKAKHEGRVTTYVPSGAKPWNELRSTGATDAQISTNLDWVDGERAGKYRIDRNYVGAGKYEHQLQVKAGSYSYSKVIGGEKLLLAIRRVLGIPFPPHVAKAQTTTAPGNGKSKKTSKPAAKKPAAKKPAAKKSSPKAPAAKKPAPKGAATSKPASAKKPAKSGAQKRREKKEREEKAAAAKGKSDPEGEPGGNPVTKARLDEEVRTMSGGLYHTFADLVDHQGAVLPPSLKAQVVEARRQAAGNEPSCCECGCTEEKACPGGCSWVSHPTEPIEELCSACLPIVEARLAAANGSTTPAAVAGIEKRGVVNSDEVPPAIANKRSRAGVAQQAAQNRAARNGHAAAV